MPTSLLTTKLNIPQVQPRLVPRQHLIDRLDHGLRMGRRMTLVSAPAGYGKTSILAEWIHHLGDTGLAVTWLSLDERDDKLARFLSYLVAALQPVDPRLGASILEVLNAPHPHMLSPEALIATLVNEMAETALPFVLVLDDYHTVIDQAIHDAVHFLLEQMPPHAHLAISTRHDPPLSLTRLHGQGQVTEIRQQDLQFTPEEAAAFLQHMELSLQRRDVATLIERTEGWIAGLQLAALSLQGKGSQEASRFIARFSGRYHFVLDYLTDQVLEHQPAPVQTFLLDTAILDRMCGPLCDAIVHSRLLDGETPVEGTARFSSSQQILEYLEHANLFMVPLDDERRWYRYHRLFADLLRTRLEEKAPARLAELHCLAASWYDENGLSAEAVDHALRAQDPPMAASILERAIHQTATWSQVDVATFTGWLDSFPQDVIRSRPWLQLSASRVRYLAGDQDSAEHLLRELEDSLHAGSSPDAERLLGLITADRASYAAVRGEVKTALALVERALGHLPRDSHATRMRFTSIQGLAYLRAGDVRHADQAFTEAIAAAFAVDLPYAAALFTCNLAEVQTLRGQLRQAMETCKRALALGTIDGRLTAPAGFAGIAIAKVLYEWNDLGAAQEAILQGLDLLKQGGTPDGFGTGHAVLAQIARALGDETVAMDAIQQAAQAAASFGIPRVVHFVAAHRARLWLTSGRTDLASQWAREYERIGETEYLRAFEDLTLARVLLAEHRPHDALPLLDTHLQWAQSDGRVGHEIETRALRALCRLALDDLDHALASIKRALDLAEPEGYVRTFVDTGDPMALLLQETAHEGHPYALHLLSSAFVHLEDGQAAGAAQRTAAASPLPEPLTDREREVLLVLAEGLSNAEIARRLVISLPTVKSHTRNIYGKLGVHSRRDAVTRARQLGILPPA